MACFERETKKDRGTKAAESEHNAFLWRFSWPNCETADRCLLQAARSGEQLLNHCSGLFTVIQYTKTNLCRRLGILFQVRLLFWILCFILQLLLIFTSSNACSEACSSECSKTRSMKFILSYAGLINCTLRNCTSRNETKRNEICTLRTENLYFEKWKSVLYEMKSVLWEM